MTTKYTTTSGSKTVFHHNTDCPQIKKYATVKERSDSFVEWHYLNPCNHCVTGEMGPRNTDSAQDLNNLLKKLGEHA
jgi:hypothetical protein